MPSTQALKLRIRSVKNTKQITKAMQLVAASKMRRAQESEKASDPYTAAANELLSYLAEHGYARQHPLFAVREVKARLLIVVASDKGLAGAYNSNIFKLYAKELQADRVAGITTKTITVGRRATQFATRIKQTDVLGAYDDVADRPDGHTLHAILDTVQRQFTSGNVDAVDIIYTDFISSMTQTPNVKRVLPAGYTKTEPGKFVSEATYEPSLEEVLDGVAHRLVGAQIYQTLLDARASEHSMRMIAMKNATDNASDLASDLTLAMNKARQGAITQELAEISGGVEALKD
jgi:F-type H+-transporting ATPase subunit gamma